MTNKTAITIITALVWPLLTTSAYAEAVVQNDNFKWDPAKPLQLCVKYADNRYIVKIDGVEKLKGDFPGTSLNDCVRLDPYLVPNKTLEVTFLGYNGPPPMNNPNPWRFDLVLEDMPGTAFSPRKDYSAKSDGHAAEGLSYVVYLKITQ